MLKIDIISGFLGAGKTTFIKRLLETKIKDEKVVLIENEFGEVSVDGEFLSDSKINIEELSQGCICCSLAGDFANSLNDVIQKFNPDRILIEPSGVGKLSDVKKAIVDAQLGQFLNSFICLVDSKRAKMYAKNFGEFFSDQIKSASTVILSRTDIASEEKIETAVNVIRDLNPNCHIVATPIKELDDEALFKAYEGIDDNLLESLMEEAKAHHHEHHHHEDEEECCCCGHDHHHHHDEECECGHEHHHHHDEECECGHEHHHHHDEECECGHEHHHHHDEECECGHEHHHHHDEECSCGHEHHHHHDEECSCGHEHHQHHDEECTCEVEHEHHHHDHDHDHGDDCTCGCHHHHHASDVFQSVGIETAKTYDLEALEKILDTLANTEKYGVIVRAKGILKTTEGWKQFNLSPEEYDIVSGNPISIGKLCVIGSKLKESEIKELF